MLFTVCMTWMRRTNALRQLGKKGWYPIPPIYLLSERMSMLTSSPQLLGTWSVFETVLVTNVAIDRVCFCASCVLVRFFMLANIAFPTVCNTKIWKTRYTRLPDFAFHQIREGLWAARSVTGYDVLFLRLVLIPSCSHSVFLLWVYWCIMLQLMFYILPPALPEGNTANHFFIRPIFF